MWGQWSIYVDRDVNALFWPLCLWVRIFYIVNLYVVTIISWFRCMWLFFVLYMCFPWIVNISGIRAAIFNNIWCSKRAGAALFKPFLIAIQVVAWSTKHSKLVFAWLKLHWNSLFCYIFRSKKKKKESIHNFNLILFLYLFFCFYWYVF